MRFWRELSWTSASFAGLHPSGHVATGPLRAPGVPDRAPLGEGPPAGVLGSRWPPEQLEETN